MEILTDASVDEGAGLAPESIDPENYASLPEVQALVRDEIVAYMQPVRDEKQRYMDRVVRYWQVWQGIHNKKLYQGRADLYWRLGYKIIETLINNVKPQVFPSTASFLVEPDPMDPVALVNAGVARRLIKHDVERSKMESRIDETLRDGLIGGVTIVKTPWMSKRTRNYSRRVIPPAMQGMSPMISIDGSLVLEEGPGFIPVNIADWFIHPITARDINDADFVWEDVTMPDDYFRSMAKRGLFDGNEVELALAEDKGDSAGVVTSQAVKDQLNVRSGVTEQEVKRKRPHSRTMQEIYARFDLYGTGDIVDCKIVLLGSHILEVRQNPNFFQEPPYLAWHAIKTKNFFYGAGVMEPIEHMNIAANAMGNQMLDSIALQINHILGVNVAMLAQDVSSLKISPRAIWPSLGDPNEVFKEFRPADSTPTALAGLQLLSGVMQDIAGAPPVMQGKQSNKDGTTATEIQAVALGAAAGVRSMVRNIETSIMSPWIQRAWKLEQQFRALDKKEKVGLIPVSPQDVAGDFGLRWLVSSQVPPLQAQGQEMQDAAGAAGQPPSMPGQPPVGTLPGAPAGGGMGDNPKQQI